MNDTARIYAAGFYSASGVKTINGVASNLARPDHILESYFYIGKNHEADAIRKDKRTIFLDSGAFSMFTQGVEVDLDKYAQFIKDNSDIIHVASNLDVIGRDQEQGSYDNQKYLEKLGVSIGPVHHARDRDDWLKRYLDEKYPYIFLGGMVPETTNYLRDWLDHIWERYLTNPDGTARVKIHGFGLTTLELMLRYPWFSLDSTAWVMNSRYGICFVDIEGKTYKVHFSDQSPSRFDDGGWHYSTLKPAEKKKVDDRLAAVEATRIKDVDTELWLEEKAGFKQGYNAEAMSKMYGWRDGWNIDYFNRVQARIPKTFHRVQSGLFV